MKKILIHSCCAPCSTTVWHNLKNNNLYFAWFNPNIEPKDEYKRRLESFSKFIGFTKTKAIIIDNYENDNKDWHKYIDGLEKESEGGKRCSKCFEFRLSKISQYAIANDFEAFTTSLTVSPHKKTEDVNRVGKTLGIKRNILFIERDFKKKNGYQLSVDLSKKMGLYRQSYCGCLYSKK